MRRRVLGIAAGAAAAIVLGVASTVALAATAGPAWAPFPAARGRCATLATTGAAVEVVLADMGALMGKHAGPMMGNPTGPGGWPAARLTATPGIVPAGTLTLRAVNYGRFVHELVVMPLAADQPAGRRLTRGDGRVDETGSVGEASATCAVGTGDGIAPGTAGWTIVTLPAGRYELLCNLPGHYAAGMYTELDVHGQ